MLTRKASFLGSISLFLTGLALGGEAIPNWPAPATWSPAKPHGGLTTMGDVTFPLPFIGLAPCRILDTRNPPGPYGAPALAGGVPRNFTLTGQCGIPTEEGAASLNVTVTNTQGPGFILIYPQGGSQPTVSTLNYVANQTIANAAVVPLGTGGGITVIAGVSGTDLILDINGYYASAPASPGSFFINTSGSSAIAASSSFTDGIAISGSATATTGAGVGVLGESNSTGSGALGVWGNTASVATNVAGVYGVDGTGNPSPAAALSAGVRGDSRTSFGVLGRSRNVAVVGALYNNAGTDIGEGYLGLGFGTAADTTSGAWAVFASGALGATGAKHFVEPHPEDPNKVLLYSSLEGRTVDTYFRGTARFVNREAVIEVPEDFRIVTAEEGLTVQITPIGGFASAYVESRDLNRIVVRSSKDVEFDYLVQGLRRAYKDFRPVRTGLEFMPRSAEDRMPAYLTEEARRRLIANGTYNPDGAVNMETAERLGWAKVWRDREEQTKEAAESACKTTAGQKK